MPEPPSNGPPIIGQEVVCSDVGSKKFQNRVVRAAFEGYQWGHEYLQVNSPTCDGIVGSLFIRLPHKDASSEWTWGQFEGGRAGWLPTKHLKPYVPEDNSQNFQHKIKAANIRVHCLEAELADLQQQLQEAGIQKHQF